MNQHPSNPSQHTQAQELEALRARIGRLCVRIRLVLITRSLLLTGSILAGLVSLLIITDFALRLPMGVRLITLGGLVYGLWICSKRYIRPAFGLGLSKTDLALQIERKDPALRGLLASAIDEEMSKNAPTSSSEIQSALVAASSALLARRLRDLPIPPMLDLKDLARWAVLFIAIAGCLTMAGLRSPNLARIGLERVMMPWTMTSWPKRFAIVDTTAGAARPIDIAVPIGALIGSSATADGVDARARVSWRVLTSDGRAINPWTQTTLASQRRRDELGHPIYEQLIDAQRVTNGIQDASFTLEYRIVTRDDQSPTREITLVRPPELVETLLTITLPAYASSLSGSFAVESGAHSSSLYDWGISPILARSTITISWRFSKPIELGPRLPTDSIPQWAQQINQENTIIHLGQSAPDTIELELLALTSGLIEPGVLDAMGIPVRTPIALSLGVLDDFDPGALIIEPTRDEMVSTHALIQLDAELTDDFGLLRGSIESTHARSGSDSSGASPEAIEDPVNLLDEPLDGLVRSTLSTVLDLSKFALEPGDELWLNAVAWDLRSNQPQADVSQTNLSQTSEPSMNIGRTRSSTRVLRMVTDGELIEQIRNRISPITNALRQLDEMQAGIQDRLRDGELETSQDQRAVSGRINHNLNAIKQLNRTLDRNTLDEPGLGALLSDAATILDEALEASDRASERLDRGQRERADESQRAVRERVGELLSMLDRGQDSWLALRSIEKLRDELRVIHDQTKDLASSTAGREIDELSPEEQSALERIMERQIGAADDARAALSTLDEQAERLEEHDPSQAQALRKAAASGRSAQIEQRLQEASEQIGSNQTSSASQTQSEVLKELEEMLEELERSIKDRDNALRRELASIIDSIKVLIGSQKNEIERVNEPDADIALITLVGNTLEVRDQALGAFPETRSIADLINSSADAQSNAINTLREDPGDTTQHIAKALRFERTSLVNLQSALEEANRLDEQAAQRQAEQRRAELRDAYRGALDTQTAVRDQTRGLGTEPMNRRMRAGARALGTTQTQLRVELADMLDQTEELSDAPVFLLAHSQLDRQMNIASAGLGERAINPRVLRSQEASIVLLATLVEVLSDPAPSQDEKDFDDGSQGGSGSGEGGGEEPVIPPIAQLKLLRSMQQLAAMQTRAFADDPASVDASDLEGLSDLQRQLFEHGHMLLEDMSNQSSPTNEPTIDSAIDSAIDSDGGIQ